MIGKTAKFATGFKAVLDYCYYAVKENGSLDKTQVRGEYLDSGFLYTPLVDDARIHGAIDPFTGKPLEGERLDIATIAQQYEKKAALNRRMEKPSWHQIFSFPKGEEPPQEIMIKILDDFMEGFGLDKSQFMAFIHRDKDHTHVHSVHNRVDLNGVNNSKKYNNYIEVSRFCRKMEEKYNLVKVEPMKAAVVQDTYKELGTDAAGRLRLVLDEGIEKYSTEKELIQHVEKKGYKVLVGRGITFVDKMTGDTFKGSDLGRDYSYKNLQIRLEKSGEEKHEMSATVTAKEILKTHILDATNQSGNKAEYIEFLQEKHGVRVEEKPFQKDAVRQSGKTYTRVEYHFTHQGKECLIPQSELGEAFSLSNLDQAFGKMLPQQNALKLRMFITDNLPLHKDTQSLLNAVEKNTDYKPVIESYVGQGGQPKERLMFVHKSNPKDRINSYDTSRHYTLQGLNTHYGRTEDRSFTQTVRDELNGAVPQSTSMDELAQRLKQKGLVLTVITQKYGKEKVYNQRKLIAVTSANDKSQSVEQKYLGKTYSYDALKKQLARNDDEQLRDRILTTIKGEAPGIRNVQELWTKLRLSGIEVKERMEPNAAGVQERHLTFSLLDKTGKTRELDSSRFGLLNRSAIQRKIDEQNRDRDKDDLRRSIDQGISRGLQPDQLARHIKTETDFDTKTSLRRIGEQTKTILTFSRVGQVKPVSNNHLEDQYSTEKILIRCQQTNPKGYAEYIQRIADNKLEYPIQINDRDMSTRSVMKEDLLMLRNQSQSLPTFLESITRDGRYKWGFVETTQNGPARVHQESNGTRNIDGIAFGREGEVGYTSGIALDKNLSYPALNMHFAQQGRGLSAGGGDPKAKNTHAAEDSKPHIQSTAAQVASEMEAQHNKIQADLDRQSTEINKQERDASGIDRRANQANQANTASQQGQNTTPQTGRRLRKKRGPRF